MKKLSQENDLILIEELNYSAIPTYKEMIFITFMIILYYSKYARWLFWFLLIIFIILFIIHFIEIKNNRTKHKIICNELRRRNII